MKLKKLKMLSSIVSISAFLGALSLLVFSGNQTKNVTRVNADSNIGTKTEVVEYSYLSDSGPEVVFDVTFTNNASIITTSSTPYVTYTCGFYLSKNYTVDGVTFTNTIDDSLLVTQYINYDVLDGIYPTSIQFNLFDVQYVIPTLHTMFGMKFNVDWYDAEDNILGTSNFAWILSIQGQSVYEDEVMLYQSSDVNIDLVGVGDVQQYVDGYGVGFQDGYTEGYNQGNAIGNNSGYDEGYADASSQFETYYNNGYASGYQAGQNEDSTIATIFGGIIQVALVPVNFFLGIFNFEILGINLRSFIQALFTVAITIIVVKAVFGGKGGGSGD